jgi:hypothetical protein
MRVVRAERAGDSLVPLDDLLERRAVGRAVPGSRTERLGEEKTSKRVSSLRGKVSSRDALCTRVDARRT